MAKGGLESGEDTALGAAERRASLHRVLDRGLVRNIIALLGVQVARYLVPLVTIPYLTRVLGVVGWGRIAHVEAFGFFLSGFVDFSFSTSATREVARHQDDRNARSRILAGVIGAKAFLAAVAIGLAYVVAKFSPTLSEDPRLFWAGVGAAIAQSFSLLWYFQGLERMRLVAALDIAGKVLGAAGIFLFVRAPSDAWKVLALQGSSVLLLSGCAFFPAYRDVPFHPPTARLALGALRSGWILFLSRMFTNLYTAGITLVLGMAASPVVVGYYAGAEKLARAIVRLLQPISLAVFPRVSFLVSQNPEQARAQVRTWFFLMGLTGLSLGAGLFVAAPFLVQMLLGPGFEPSIMVLRMLALLPPLLAFNNVFGVQWMLPLGLDHQFNSIVIASGIGAVLLALLLAPAHGHVGAASASLAGEAAIVAGMLLVLSRRQLSPFARAGEMPTRLASDVARMAVPSSPSRRAPLGD